MSKSKLASTFYHKKQKYLNFVSLKNLFNTVISIFSITLRAIYITTIKKSK